MCAGHLIPDYLFLALSQSCPGTSHHTCLNPSKKKTLDRLLRDTNRLVDLENFVIWAYEIDDLEYIMIWQQLFRQINS